MRLLICGSRTVGTPAHVEHMMDALNMVKSLVYIETVIHGDAKGADTIGKEWAWINKVPVLAYPANWNAYGKRAGPIRNVQMLQDGRPTAVLAFIDKPLELSRGTAHMVRISREKLGAKAVRVVEL